MEINPKGIRTIFISKFKFDHQIRGWGKNFNFNFEIEQKEFLMMMEFLYWI